MNRGTITDKAKSQSTGWIPGKLEPKINIKELVLSLSQQLHVLKIKDHMRKSIQSCYFYYTADQSQCNCLVLLWLPDLEPISNPDLEDLCKSCQSSQSGMEAKTKNTPWVHLLSEFPREHQPSLNSQLFIRNHREFMDRRPCIH